MKKIILIPLWLLIAVVAAAQSATDGMVDAIEQMGQDQVDNIGDAAESAGNVNSSIGDALGHLNTFMGIARDAQELYNASQALSNGECAPDFSTNSSAMMPSSCTEGDCR